MKKLMMMAAAAMALSTAGAQTWASGNGNLTLNRCYQGSGQYVLCDFDYTLTKEDTSELKWSTSDLVYYLANGTSGHAYSVSTAGSDFDKYYGNATIIKGVPTETLFALDLPSGSTSILAMVIAGHRIDNVPIRASATAPAPAPAARPAATTTTSVNTSAYNAVLTSCKAGANGTLTCSATLTPRR